MYISTFGNEGDVGIYLGGSGEINNSLLLASSRTTSARDVSPASWAAFSFYGDKINEDLGGMCCDGECQGSAFNFCQVDSGQEAGQACAYNSTQGRRLAAIEKVRKELGNLGKGDLVRMLGGHESMLASL